MGHRDMTEVLILICRRAHIDVKDVTVLLHSSRQRLKHDYTNSFFTAVAISRSIKRLTLPARAEELCGAKVLIVEWACEDIGTPSYGPGTLTRPYCSTSGIESN